MEQVAFRVFRRPETHDRPLKESPQRVSVKRIELPHIPFEYRFLYENGLNRVRLASKFLKRQDELRANAVKAMVDNYENS